MEKAAKKMNKGARTSGGSALEGAEETEAEDEAHSHSRSSSVLWERYIEQSIIVDISEDDSLHFSDIQGAFTVHLSQTAAQDSPQLTDDAEMSESFETEEGNSHTRNRKENATKAPMQKLPPAGKPVTEKHEDDAVNTSDEEHEDLPYDGAHINPKTETNLKPSHCEILQTFSTLDKFSRQSGHAEKADACQSNPTSAILTNQKAAQDVAPPPSTPTPPVGHITDILLRHFSKEELMNSGRIIEAETLPEMSLIDSIDETVRSKASQICVAEEMETINDAMEKNDEVHTELEASIESSSSKEPEIKCISHVENARADEDDDKEHLKQNCIANSLDLAKSDAQSRSFIRTRSYSELKYGQGKVHYPLPDFSKVAPKVKIPKVNASFKPVSQSPGMARAQSSPGILGKATASCKATADVISRVLEDSVMPPENVFADKEVAHQLQVEYDRLLAKYTDTENLIGQQIHASSEPSVTIDWDDETDKSDNTKLTANNPPAPTAAGPSEKQFICNPVETESDGERLTSELRDIIRSFMLKVDEFKTCVTTTMSMDVEEQQMMLKSMMEAQDQLERNYLTKRDEHRALEMQNYRGLSRNTGQFDPDREVEGQIFRIGMYLEDIKEQIDRNVCFVFNPPPSSSTPPPPSEVVPLSSSHPSLHEELNFSISSVGQNIEEDHDEDASDDHTANAPENSFCLQDPTSATETPATAIEEEVERSTAAEDDQQYEDVQTRASTSASLKQLTQHRCEEKIRRSEASSSSVRPSAANSPQPTTDKTQSFLSPETDSGFGSFDLSRPNTGLSQIPSSAVSSALSDDVISMASMSGSDSEASHSNARTTISMAKQPVQATVNHCKYEQQTTQARNITQNSPVRPPKQDVASVGGATTMHYQVTEVREDVQLRNEKHSASHCSCHNSEVILTLQYEVSRLKRALEESLGHVSKRSDYYPNGRVSLERKSKGQNRAAFSRHVKTDSKTLRIEDWISSDIDLSKSKDGVDSDALSFQRAFSPSDRELRTRFSPDRSHDSRASSKASVEHFPPSSIQRASAEPNNRSASYRPASEKYSVGILGNNFLNSTKLASSFPAYPSHKPLLQVNYGSSSSLPAGFKLQDYSSDSVISRRRSTQSDSALLPSNVYFQRTSTRTSERRHRTRREESIHRTLDKALQAAFQMKQTTDRMADALSADLAKAQLQRKIQGLRPVSSRART